MFRGNEWGGHDHCDSAYFKQEHENCQWHSHADVQVRNRIRIEVVTERIKMMSLARVIARISVTICVIGVTAIGQQEPTPHQTAPKTPLELCMDAMPTIFKNYNTAKYAVFRIANSHDAGPAREAQAELDAIEQPLKSCYEASQNRRPEQQPDSKR